MGEKEGTAPSGTKKQLERTKKCKQQPMHEFVVCLSLRWRQHHRLPVPHLALPTQQQEQERRRRTP